MPDLQGTKKNDFPQEVHVRERRKLRARKKKTDEVWFGLGMFGMVGWSVAIPTVLGIFMGVWIDLTWTSRYSWTLMLLVVGLAIGCANAWFWINRQRRSISRDREDDDTD
jgi:ATP synthase protein I